MQKQNPISGSINKSEDRVGHVTKKAIKAMTVTHSVNFMVPVTTPHKEVC